MPNILHISEAASLALHAMTALAHHPEKNWPTLEVAETLGASEHTLSKVMQRLAKAGLLKAERGPHGGFTLARPAKSIRLLDVYEAVEGPLGPPACLLGSPVCGGKECVLGGLVQSIHAQVRKYLGKTTLATLADRVAIGA